MQILCIVGTRPNFMKVAALYAELRPRHWATPTLLHTGQHHEANMSTVFFQDLGLPQPDVYLGVSGGTHTYQTALIMQRLEPVLREMRPDLVIVVGDVNSTLAAALVANQCGIPLAHVEAGLRSRDRTMPEEINRLLVDQLADFLFVSEEAGVENLRAEGIPEERIHFVGNVMIDTLLNHLNQTDDSAVLRDLSLAPQQYVLATLHRPANTDDPSVLGSILTALAAISHSRTTLLPLHPRTRKRIGEFGLEKMLSTERNLRLIDPLGYLEFLSLMRNAYAVLTDSGGIQEETTILGVPCLTMRENTERPSTIVCGTNHLVGTRGERIVEAYRRLPATEGHRKSVPQLWDGHAAERILNILERRLPEIHARHCCTTPRTTLVL